MTNLPTSIEWLVALCQKHEGLLLFILGLFTAEIRSLLRTLRRKGGTFLRSYRYLNAEEKLTLHRRLHNNAFELVLHIVTFTMASTPFVVGLGYAIYYKYPNFIALFVATILSKMAELFFSLMRLYHYEYYEKKYEAIMSRNAPLSQRGTQKAKSAKAGRKH